MTMSTPAEIRADFLKALYSKAHASMMSIAVNSPAKHLSLLTLIISQDMTVDFARDGKCLDTYKITVPDEYKGTEYSENHILDHLDKNTFKYEWHAVTLTIHRKIFVCFHAYRLMAVVIPLGIPDADLLVLSHPELTVAINSGLQDAFPEKEAK